MTQAALREREIDSGSKNEQVFGMSANKSYDFNEILFRNRVVLNIDEPKDKAVLANESANGVISTSVGQKINFKNEPQNDYLFKLPPVVKSRENFIVLQKWEGSVVKVGRHKKVFSAVLKDLMTNVSEEEVLLNLNEVSEADLELVAPGAVFYWYIGYIEKAEGQRNRTSSIRFRRLPATSKIEVKLAQQRANELHKLFNE